jgi:uncharacterized protein (TIGR03083 family)
VQAIAKVDAGKKSSSTCSSAAAHPSPTVDRTPDRREALIVDETLIRAATGSERLSLADFLDGLDEAEWATQSLCAEWTVRDVAAHLTIPTRTSLPGMVIAMVMARGDFHRMTSRGAGARAAAFTAAQLTEQLRETAGSTRRMPGSGPMAPLVDILVHGQDIARPLGRRRSLLPSLRPPRSRSWRAPPSTAAPSVSPSSGSSPPTPATPWGKDRRRCEGRPVTCSWWRPGGPPGLAGLSGPGVARLADRFPTRAC